MKIRALSCALVAALVSVSAFAQAPQTRSEHVIDLVSVSSARTGSNRPHDLQVRSSVSAHAPKDDDVRVMAPEFDRAEYRVGEPLFFDVVVKNVGEKPLKFPTTLDDSLADRGGPDTVTATVALTFVDAVLGRQTVAPQVLYGANDIPGSLIVVHPQETVRIHAPGVWLMSAARGTPNKSQWPRELQVKALLTVVRNGISESLGLSQTAAPITLRMATR